MENLFLLILTILDSNLNFTTTKLNGRCPVDSAALVVQFRNDWNTRRARFVNHQKFEVDAVSSSFRFELQSVDSRVR
jgi:hypothetical protein